MARAYRVFWGEHLHHGLFRSGQESPQAAQLELIRHCLALVGDVNEAEVLDVGCGYGGTSIYLALHHRCRVTALTLSAKQADHARKRARLLGASSTARFLVVNAEEYAYSEGGYDLIWVMESSEHFLDRKLFFQASCIQPKSWWRSSVNGMDGQLRFGRSGLARVACVLPQFPNGRQLSRTDSSSGPDGYPGRGSHFGRRAHLGLGLATHAMADALCPSDTASHA